MLQENNRKYYFRCNLLLYASLQFMVMTFIAMYLYKGGYILDPNTRSYSFLHNFLSDLGMVNTYSGESNIVPLIIFGFATAFMGLSFALFANICYVLAFKNLKGITVGKLGSLSGITGGLLFAAVAVLPWDLMFNAHFWCVNSAYFFISLFIVCLTIVQILNKLPGKFILLNSIYFSILIIHFLILLFGPRYTTPEGLPLHAVAQKVSIYFSILIVFLQVLWIRDFIKTPKLT